MKFFFSLLFLTTPLLAQVCTESTLTTASFPLYCDSLSLNSDINLNSVSDPIEINVNGNAIINARINISGQDGQLIDDSVGGTGGLGGPGASRGGGAFFLEIEETPDKPQAGKEGEKDFSANCGDGAGGGGFQSPGQNGTPCLTSINPPAPGGISTDFTTIQLFFRGGYGGGAGGGATSQGLDNMVASGGGGGGAIYIKASGQITLTSQGLINANGGNGADSVNRNGGGGGGSGGVIILEANILDLQGKLLARGGKGGQAPNGGHGGDGSSGLIRLKDSNGVVDYIGEKDFTPEKEPDSQELKLNSSISCGTIDSNNDGNGGNLLFQVLLPLFFLIAMTHFKKKFQDLF